MKILVMTTGGTIGSGFDGTAIDVGSGCPAVEQYIKEHPEVEAEITSPLNLLSERISAEDLSVLAGALLRIEQSAYDGVVLTCGSDTLGYVAAMVGLLCADFAIPVTLVAANLILSDPLSNGYENLCCAVEVIRIGTRGVFVPYRNSDGVMCVHAATAVRQPSYSDDLHSLYDTPYAVFDGGPEVLCEYPSQGIPSGIFSAQNPPDFKGKVLVISPYAGMSYDAYSLDGYDAVLHLLYHSATLDAQKFREFMRRAGDTPVFLCSLRADRKPYRTTLEAIEAGGVPLYDISPECAYMKLMLALCQHEVDIMEFMGVKR